MTAREIVSKRMAHEGTEITPYSLGIEYELRQKLNEYYKDENWYAKKLRTFTRSYLSADTVMMRQIDDVYSTDGYGALWRMDRKPWHLEKPPFDEPVFDAKKFPTSEVFVNNILAQKENAIKLYNEDTEHYRIIDMGWGIFEQTWRLRGFENALMDMLADEDFYAELSKSITDIYIDMIKACEDVPAEAYLFGDDWGDQRGVIMGAASWRKFLKPCWARIYAEVHGQGKQVMQHSCGSITTIYDDLIEIGMNCHESVQPEAAGMEPSLVKKNWGSKLSFWGCLGSQGILTHGTSAEIVAEIHRLVNLFKEDGGYILAPAKPLAAEMPVEKAVAVIETFAEING
jgi:Uroporphyrinogen-III decarboxylase